MNKILIIDDDRELCALIKRSVQTEPVSYTHLDVYKRQVYAGGNRWL